ncbi:MAG: hypothetical protein JNM66_13055 [Bryobacterales bacterium]|nr:hypothetical protein [Bryobacterales bacterium]
MLSVVRSLFVGAAIALSLPAASPPANGLSNFEPNTSQYPSRVCYFARAAGYTLELTNSSLVMSFPGASPLTMRFPGGRPAPVEAAPPFTRIRYRAVFPGVDMDIYHGQAGLEYDWIVAPRADPASVRFSFSGAQNLRLAPNGDLVLETLAGQVRHRRPRVYQRTRSGERDIRSSFLLHGNTVGFLLGPYDRHRPLIIDPEIIFAAATGSSYRVDSGTIHVINNSTVADISTDRAGNSYLSGSSVQCVSCVFVTKLSADGTRFLYRTTIAAAPARYLSPGFHPHTTSASVTDPDGNVYVTVIAGEAATAGGTDVLLIKLDPDGKTKAAMVIGGAQDDGASAISLGPDGFLYIAGTTLSPDFPVSAGAFRSPAPGKLNFFALKVDPKALDGETPWPRAVVYSALLGAYSPTQLPLNADRIERFPRLAAAADASGNAYIAAYTDCFGLRPSPGTLHPNCGLPEFVSTAAILKLDRTGANVLWTAILSPSSGSRVDRLAVTPRGDIYVAGGAAPGFPVSANAIRKSAIPREFTNTAFVAKLNSSGTAFAYATYLDGCCGVGGLAVDSAGNPVIAGFRGEQGFTKAGGLYSQVGGFLGALTPDGGALAWFTFLGAGYPSAATLDSAGNVLVAGNGINPGKAVAPSMSGPSLVLKVSPSGNPALIDGVADSAAFGPGLPRSGGLASVFVHGLDVLGQAIAPGPPFQSKLAGVEILAGGVPAPILSISNVAPPHLPASQQINIQVPFQSAGPYLELRHKGLSSFAVADVASPAIFTLPGGLGAVQHASTYALVTPQHPARKGEVIVVYATGLGPVVSPPVPAGSPAPGPAPVLAPACGTSRSAVVSSAGEVLYAGLTPSFPGLYQVNIRLSPNLPSGQSSLVIALLSCTTGNRIFPLRFDSNAVPLPVE